MSGVSHLRMGNVSKKLFLSLLLPGIGGALAGVYIVGQVDAAVLKPYVSADLLIMGVYVFSKAFKQANRAPAHRSLAARQVVPLALGRADGHQRRW